MQTDIVDIKPANMEELTEVITAAEFHPTACHLFVYSSSKGTIRLCDMRSQAICDKHTKRESKTLCVFTVCSLHSYGLTGIILCGFLVFAVFKSNNSLKQVCIAQTSHANWKPCGGELS